MMKMAEGSDKGPTRPPPAPLAGKEARRAERTKSMGSTRGVQWGDYDSDDAEKLALEKMRNNGHYQNAAGVQLPWAPQPGPLAPGAHDQGQPDPTPTPAMDFDHDAVAFHVRATDALNKVLYTGAAENTGKL